MGSFKSMCLFRIPHTFFCTTRPPNPPLTLCFDLLRSPWFLFLFPFFFSRYRGTKGRFSVNVGLITDFIGTVFPPIGKQGSADPRGQYAEGSWRFFHPSFKVSNRTMFVRYYRNICLRNFCYIRNRCQRFVFRERTDTIIKTNLLIFSLSGDDE